MKVHLTTVIGSFVKVMPHMLAHYRELGLSSFLVNVHLSHPHDPIIKEVERVTSEFGCDIASATVADWNLEQTKLADISRQRFPDDWFIYADQDELQVYPDDLFEIISYCDQHGYDYIKGAFIDRMGPDGSLPDVTSDASLWSQFPLGGMITSPILGGYPLKVVAAKGHVALSTGQHYAFNGRACPTEEFFIQIHHFKWIHGIIDHLKLRTAQQKDLNLSHWNESQKIVSYFEKHNGKFDVSDRVLLITECHQNYPFWEYLRHIYQVLEYASLQDLYRAGSKMLSLEPYAGHFHQLLSLHDR